MTIGFSFYGQSWALGVLCGLVISGVLSPWWLLLTPTFLFDLGGYVMTFKWPKDKGR